MSDYIKALASLTEEEQALFAQETRDDADLQRLEVISVQRAMLWELERRRRAGHAPQPIPTSIPIAKREEQPPPLTEGAAQLIADLIAYQETQR
jgi:hypothetical protein